MADRTQELLVVNNALNHLEERIRAYRTYILASLLGHQPDGFERLAVPKTEVEAFEALVHPFVKEEALWEPMHAYCSRNEEKGRGSEQDYEYLWWALSWIEITRTFLANVGGPHSGKDILGSFDARSEEERNQDTEPGRNVPPSSADERRVDYARKIEKGKGGYVGKIVWTPLPDGRLMEVIETFSFIDPAGLKWTVPPGTQVDGASIPQPLWSIVGSPFTGKYRDASVIHDYYCDVRLRLWKAVHRVFYDAMIVSDVGKLRAKVMYAAVYFGGPRWSEAAVHNSNLPRPPLIDLYTQHSPFALEVMKLIEVDGTSADDFFKSGQTMPPPGSEIRLHLKELKEIISDYDPSPEQIASALDIAEVIDWLIPRPRTLVVPEDLKLWIISFTGNSSPSHN